LSVSLETLSKFGKSIKLGNFVATKSKMSKAFVGIRCEYEIGKSFWYKRCIRDCIVREIESDEAGEEPRYQRESEIHLNEAE
jgi:hypothetical protein